MQGMDTGSQRITPNDIQQDLRLSEKYLQTEQTGLHH
jgi:hypothetical protein